MKKYSNFNKNDCNEFEKPKLCLKLKEKYNGGENGEFLSIEKEIVDGISIYIAWVKPYNNIELFKGKVGMSESNGKEHWIVLSTQLKDHDDAGWIEHEKGHIIGYSKGYDKKIGTVIDKNKVFNLETYPNVWFEFEPFKRQMLFLKNIKKLPPLTIIRNMMKDYENSTSHKGKIDELKQIEQFFIEFYKEYVEDVDINNKYNKK